ncbi:hypothetical protein [Pseudomonas sp. NA-150]|uniref:hypothetical protein n=1 Tax=Pseudomonas sp. NA-150 TaxID=3367525 RepID=UPI0037C8FAB8
MHIDITEHLNLNDEELQELSTAELSDFLTAKTNLILKIPLPHVNNSNSYIDIISNYIDASYFVEKTASYFKTTTLKKDWSKGYQPQYLLTVVDFDNTLLANHIKDFMWAFQYPENEDDHDKFHDVRSEINLFEDDITDTKLQYPEIADEYFANLINGAYYELDTSIFKHQLSFFPERNYGYWKAPSYNGEENGIMVSSNGWIVPTQITIQDAFKSQSQDGDISLLNSQFLTLNAQSIIITEGSVVLVPLGKILQALACIESTAITEEKYTQKLNWDGNIFSQAPSTVTLLEKNTTLTSIQTGGLSFYTSEFLDFIVIKTKLAQIVIFDILELSKSESERYIGAARQLFSSFDDNIDSPSAISLPWEKLDDEAFEQICYDIIYHNSKFDNKTIRKLGKSRSRDGGRDIVVHTVAKLGERPRKYIFQCKFSLPTKTIGISNIGSITDTIEQYGAEGYGIMCNCYIDASLYDRLDAIAEHRKMNTETWSKFEVERFIARRPTIKARHFEINT